MDRICEQLANYVVENYESASLQVFKQCTEGVPTELRDSVYKQLLAYMKDSMPGLISELYALGGSVESVKDNLEALGEASSVALGDVASEMNVDSWFTYEVSWDFGHKMMPSIGLLLGTFRPESNAGTSVARGSSDVTRMQL